MALVKAHPDLQDRLTRATLDQRQETARALSKPRTLKRALRMAERALKRADQLIEDMAPVLPPPSPIACKAETPYGCHIRLTASAPEILLALSHIQATGKTRPPGRLRPEPHCAKKCAILMLWAVAWMRKAARIWAKNGCTNPPFLCPPHSCDKNFLKNSPAVTRRTASKAQCAQDKAITKTCPRLYAQS